MLQVDSKPCDASRPRLSPATAHVDRDAHETAIGGEIYILIINGIYDTVKNHSTYQRNPNLFNSFEYGTDIQGNMTQFAWQKWTLDTQTVDLRSPNNAAPPMHPSDSPRSCTTCKYVLCSPAGNIANLPS